MQLHKLAIQLTTVLFMVSCVYCVGIGKGNAKRFDDFSALESSKPSSDAGFKPSLLGFLILFYAIIFDWKKYDDKSHTTKEDGD
ncbi:MAG: hypothetical protein NVS3B3_15530 [Aquirhabdus sp.]